VAQTRITTKRIALVNGEERLVDNTDDIGDEQTLKGSLIRIFIQPQDLEGSS
jgi:hypothetical protein